MKRALLLPVMMMSLLLLATPAPAWYVQAFYRDGGDINEYSTEYDKYCQLDTSGTATLNLGARLSIPGVMASWGVENTYSYTYGEEERVQIEYYTEEGGLQEESIQNMISFQILSEYGRSEPETVTVRLDAFVDAMATADSYPASSFMGLYGDAHASAWLELSSLGMPIDFLEDEAFAIWDDYSGPYDDPMDDMGEFMDWNIELQTNTLYYLGVNLSAHAMADFIDELPTDMSADEFEAFFAEGDRGDLWASADAHLGFNLEVESVEHAVPVPGAAWLLGSGLLGLLGIRRHPVVS